MNKQEWMPVNPCIECRKIHPCECAKWWIYQGKLDMARELLEYLRSNYEDWDRDWVSLPSETIPSMLKQLEEMK